MSTIALKVLFVAVTLVGAAVACTQDTTALGTSPDHYYALDESTVGSGAANTGSLGGEATYVGTWTASDLAATSTFGKLETWLRVGMHLTISSATHTRSYPRQLLSFNHVVCLFTTNLQVQIRIDSC